MTSPIHILNAQKGWLAIDKPSGLSVHNDPGGDLITLITQQIENDKHLRSQLGNPARPHVQPVHRLDKETSGVILMATEPDALTQLSILFKEKRVKKKYIAMVHGRFDSLEPGQRGPAWKRPLTRKAGGRNNPAGTGKRVACETRYTLIDQSPHYALLDIDLITGRKHQIRRQAKLSGHPVVGDSRYGSKRAIAFLKNNYAFSRLCLHCQTVELPLPCPDKKSDKTPDKTTRIVSENPLEEIYHLFEQDRQNQ